MKKIFTLDVTELYITMGKEHTYIHALFNMDNKHT